MAWDLDGAMVPFCMAKKWGFQDVSHSPSLKSFFGVFRNLGRCFFLFLRGFNKRAGPETLGSEDLVLEKKYVTGKQWYFGIDIGWVVDACWTLTFAAKAWVAETPGLVDEQTRLQLLLDNHLLFLAKGQFLPWYLQLQYLMAFKNIPSQRNMFASWILEIGKFHPTHPSNRKLSQWQNKKSLKFSHHINQNNPILHQHQTTCMILYQLQLSLRGEVAVAVAPWDFESHLQVSWSLHWTSRCPPHVALSTLLPGFFGVFCFSIFLFITCPIFEGFGIEFSWLAQETLQPNMWWLQPMNRSQTWKVVDRNWWTCTM